MENGHDANLTAEKGTSWASGATDQTGEKKFEQNLSLQFS